MSEIQPEKGGVEATIALKILYTLHGTDSQKYIVKPSSPVNARVFRDSELGLVDIKPCLAAIREASPDFASICDTHSDEYAVYSADYAEEDLPLQSHGKVSQGTMIQATGKLSLSKLRQEQLELLIHLLPVRKPSEIIAEYHQKLKSDSATTNDFLVQRGMLPLPPPPPSLANSSALNGLLPHMPLPHTLASLPAMKSDTALPSSPPVRARPHKIAPLNGHMPPSSILSEDGPNASRDQTLVYDSGGNSQFSTAGASSVNSGSSRYTARRASPEPAKKRKATSPKNDVAQCGNCGVADASTWRRARCPDGKGELLCNACGLYYRSKKVMRPRFLWDKGRSRINQETMSTPASIDVATHNALTTANAEPSSSMSSSSNLMNIHPVAATPRLDDANMPEDMAASLWSRKQTSDFTSSDTADVSDRLIDSTKQPQNSSQSSQSGQSQSSCISMDGDATSDQSLAQGFTREPNYGEGNQEYLVAPSTPQRKSNLVPLEPDSMQKWLGLSTPEQRFALMIPGSGSARKWLDKAMNPSNFDEVWNSPTPKSSRSTTIPDLTLFTSSPPTSSNMLSEVAEWNLTAASPGTPQALKFYKPDEETSHDQPLPKTGHTESQRQSRQPNSLGKPKP